MVFTPDVAKECSAEVKPLSAREVRRLEKEFEELASIQRETDMKMSTIVSMVGNASDLRRGRTAEQIAVGHYEFSESMYKSAWGKVGNARGMMEEYLYRLIKYNPLAIGDVVRSKRKWLKDVYIIKTRWCSGVVNGKPSYHVSFSKRKKDGHPGKKEFEDRVESLTKVGPSCP